jgi:uncharacterized protein with HEPN domain
MPSQFTPDKDFWRLRHMIENANLILHFGEGCSRDDLMYDIQLSLSLIKMFEIVGEAASHISDEVKSLAPDVPWTNIVGTRNKLIHEYFDIDFAILSETIKQDIPTLITKLLDLEERLRARL